MRCQEMVFRAVSVFLPLFLIFSNFAFIHIQHVTPESFSGKCQTVTPVAHACKTPLSFLQVALLFLFFFFFEMFLNFSSVSHACAVCLSFI